MHKTIWLNICYRYVHLTWCEGEYIMCTRKKWLTHTQTTPNVVYLCLHTRIHQTFLGLTAIITVMAVSITQLKFISTISDQLSEYTFLQFCFFGRGDVLFLSTKSTTKMSPDFSSDTSFVWHIALCFKNSDTGETASILRHKIIAFENQNSCRTETPSTVPFIVMNEKGEEWRRVPSSLYM